MHINYKRGETPALCKKSGGQGHYKGRHRSWKALKTYAARMFRRWVRQVVQAEKPEMAPPKYSRRGSYSQPGWQAPKGWFRE